MKCLSLLTLVTGLAFGQTFEVATVRPTALPSGADLAKVFQGGQLRVGMQVEGNQVSFGLMTLRDLAAIAYEVKPLQVTGPDWATQQRFAVTALMPEGSDAKQIPVMLQALLKDRFKLVAHKSDAEQQVYALQVSKDGHRLKEAAPLPAEPAAEAPPVPGERVLNAGGQQIRINQGGGAVITNGASGTQRMSMGPDGRMHLEADRMTMVQLAELLTPMMDFPVVDRTGLSGPFSIALDLSMADLLSVARRAGVGIPAASLPGGAGGAGLPPGLAAQDPGGDLPAAVQKLGLRLDKQKAPVDSLVIESAEKNPTEN